MQFYASAVDRASERVKNAREEVLKFNKEVERGQNIINMASKKASGVIAEPLTTPKAPKAKPIGSTPQVSGLSSSIEPAGLVETSGKVLEIAKNVQGAEGVIATSMGNIRTNFDTSGLYMLEALTSFNASANEIINNGIANTFGDLGVAIGNGLANGGNVMQSAGKALLAGMGSILTQLGQLAISTGVGILAVKKALTTLNPYVAIAAGVALVAIGSAFSSKANSIGSSGGSSSGSVSTGASVSSPTSSTSSSGSSGFTSGTVVFEISGQSLIGVLSNTLDKNKRLGGAISLG